MSRRLVHAIFKRTDCGKEFQDFLTAQVQAQQHAKSKKHLVMGEVGLAVTYDGKHPQ